MESYSKQHTVHPLTSCLFFFSSLFLLVGFLWTSPINAKPNANAKFQHSGQYIEIARRGRHRMNRGNRFHRKHRRHGRHWRNWGVIIGPSLIGASWTGWRRYGRCERTCLVDSYTGEVIRCRKRCFY